jgi:tetratricopeptide (TPR) repeat protein
MIITRLAANGDFKGADVNLAIFELRDAQRLPKDDRDKMKKRDYESMSEDGRMLALEYWRSTRLIIQGLAAKGKIQEAMRYIEGVDGDEKILAVVSVAEAKAEFGDADALTFGREGASHYKKSFPPARFWIVEAQARGFSKAGQRSLALELIANALADAPKDDEKAHLLKVRAELHRDSGDKFAAKQDIIEALAALDQNADSKVLRSALVIAPEEVKAWSKDLRGKLLQRLTQQVTDDDRDKIIMALKDLAGSLSYAGEHEDSRVTMNEAFKVLKNLDSKFRGIAAHGYCMRMLLRGEIGNVEEALALVTEKRDIRRLSEKLAYIRAKQQKLGEARATLNGELLSAEGVDLLGAGFVGWEDIVKRIFNAEPFSK